MPPCTKQPPQPPASAPRPGPCILSLALCLMPRAIGERVPVCLSCRNGSDRPSMGIRTACFVLSVHSPPLPRPVQSKGFYFALCHCGRLILSWPCSQIAVSGQRPLGLPPPSPPPGLPTCMCSLGFRSITGSTPAWPCCLCPRWTGRQPHTNPQLSTELQSRSGIST